MISYQIYGRLAKAITCLNRKFIKVTNYTGFSFGGGIGSKYEHLYAWVEAKVNQIKYKNAELQLEWFNLKTIT